MTYHYSDPFCSECDFTIESELQLLQWHQQVGDNCPQCKIGMMKMLDWQLSG